MAMTARRHLRSAVIAAFAAVGGIALPPGSVAQVQITDPPAYPSSPWHGLIDGDGNPIPCRCRFDGKEWRLGELVCMSTHVGTVLTRCDLVQNNTSWVPTTTPCTTSQSSPGRQHRFAAR